MDIQKFNMPADANINALSIKNIPVKKPEDPLNEDASDKAGDAKPEKGRRRKVYFLITHPRPLFLERRQEVTSIKRGFRAVF